MSRPFWWPMTMHDWPLKRARPPTIAWSSAKARSPCSLLEIGEHVLDVVERVGALRVAGDQRALPRRELGVDVLGQRLALDFEPGDFLGDIDRGVVLDEAKFLDLRLQFRDRLLEIQKGCFHARSSGGRKRHFSGSGRLPRSRSRQPCALGASPSGKLRAMLYRFARPLLFALDAETAHDLTLASLKLLAGTPLAPHCRADHGDPVQVMGIQFPNRSGSPPGSTRTANASTGWRPSASASSRSAPSRRGRSRATRSRACSACRKQQAIINRMGFNNRGRRHADRQRHGRASYQGRHSRHQHRQEFRHADRAARPTIT